MSDPNAESILCLGCRAAIPRDSLVCLHCKTLVHRERLANLAALATAAEAKGDFATAISRYQQMTPLLPADTTQASAIRSKLASLALHPGGNQATLAVTLPDVPRYSLADLWKKIGGGLVAAALLGWKFKFALVALLSKGKLLLLGLTNFSTVASMFAFLGVYWSLYGFSFALGLVLLIYVHEMGHVWAAKRLGVPVTAPMFIPGFGAFIGLRNRLANGVEEAYLGLAGPIWGVAGSLACIGLWAVIKSPVLLVVGTFSALINLFNLIPVWQLDGAHAFHAFSKWQRWVAALFPLAVATLIWDGMLLIVSAGAFYQIFSKRAPAQGHNPSMAQFCGLILVIALVLQFGHPVLRPQEPAPQQKEQPAAPTQKPDVITNPR